MSRVFPGVAEVIASLRLLHSILIRDDFPTLDRPMKANSGKLLSGLPETLVLLPTNLASEIFIKEYCRLFNGCKYSKSLPFFVFLREMDRDYLDLCELQRLLREGIESFFPDRLWVKAEISSVQVKANGHCYLELCSSEGGRMVAKAKAVIWRSRYQAVAAYFEDVTGSSIAAGMEVLVYQHRIILLFRRFHSGYGVNGAGRLLY